MTHETAREQILAIRQQDPEANAASMAQAIGVSRERIRQLLESMGLSKGRRSYVYPLQRAKPAARIRTGGIELPVSHTVAGTIGELLAAADLMARGFKVFIPLTRTAACDLITLDRDGKTERIEVRCGKRRVKGNGVAYNQADRSKSDRRAIVITGEPIVYNPPFLDEI